MDIKELSKSIFSFVNYDGCSPFTDNETTLIYEFEKQLFGSEVETRNMFVENHLKYYKTL